MKFFDFLENRRLALILAGILIALHIGAFSYRTVVGANVTDDSAEYMLCAQNAADGIGFQPTSEDEPYTEEAISRRTPGYPAIILAMGQSEIAVMALQALLSLATIGFCIFFVRRFTQALAPLNFLLAGFIFTPSQVIYATSVMSEIPFQFCLTLGIGTAILYFKENSSKWIILSAIAFSIGFAIKPILYPAAIIFSVAGLLFALRKKELPLIPALLLPAICVLAVASWNYTRTQALEISSIQTTNMLDYNMKLVLYQAEGQERGDWIIDSLETEAGKIQNYPNRQQFRSQKSREIFLTHPFIAAYQFTKGFILFFADPGRFDIITYAGFDNRQGFMNAFAAQDSGLIKKILNMMPPWLWAILITVLLFNIVKILCYGIFLAKVKGQQPAKILLTCGIIFIALATGPLGVSRYALPVVPLILIGGSFAFCKDLFFGKKSILKKN